MAKVGCLKLFRGSYADIKDTVLEEGEIAYVKDSKKLVIGDGTKNIIQLPWLNTLYTAIHTRVYQESPKSTLTYTDSYTIPSNTGYALKFETGYNYLSPRGCALALNNNPQDHQWIVKDNGTKYAFICGWTQDPFTVYIFGKWANNGTNTEAIMIDGFLLN